MPNNDTNNRASLSSTIPGRKGHHQKSFFYNSRCILFGTSILWNFSGMPAARWGMWKSPTTNASSPKSDISLVLTLHNTMQNPSLNLSRLSVGRTKGESTQLFNFFVVTCKRINCIKKEKEKKRKEEEEEEEEKNGRRRGVPPICREQGLR